MNVLTTEHKNLSSNPTKNDRAVTRSDQKKYLSKSKKTSYFESTQVQVFLKVFKQNPASSMNRLPVAYNNAYRILFISPEEYINETMVNNGISTFYS